MRGKRLLFVTLVLFACFLMSAPLYAAGGKQDDKPVPEIKEQAPTLDNIEGRKLWLIQEAEKANIDWRQFEGERITIAMNRHWYTDALEPYVEAFEELTGITVLMEIYSEEEFYTKLAIDLSSEAGIFDAFMQGMSFIIAQYSEAGWLEPLDSYFNDPGLMDEEWWDIQDFQPAINAGKFDVERNIYGEGTQWAIPISFECQVVLYRKDLLDEMGMEPPETMEELMDTAAKLHNPPEMYGIVNRGRRTFSGMWAWAGYFRSWGGEWFDNNWNPTFNEDPGVEAMEFYRDIHLDYGPPNMENIDWYECQTLMQTGKVGMVTDASGWISAVVDPEKSEVHDKVGVGRFPRGPVKAEPNMWYWEMAMNKFSQRKEPTWLFLMWATSKPTSLVTALSHGAPPRTGTWNHPKFRDVISEQWPPGYVDAVSFGLEHARAESSLPAIKEGPELGDQFGIALGSVFDGDPVEPALDKAARSFEAIIEDAGYK